MRSITALEARRHLGRLLDRLSRTNEEVALTRGGHTLAILVPAGRYEDSETRMRRAARRMDEFACKLGPWRGKPAEVMIREMRESR